MASPPPPPPFYVPISIGPSRFYCNSHWLATGQTEVTGPPYLVNTYEQDRQFVFNVQGSDFQPTAVKCAAVWVNETSTYRWITLDNCATSRSLYSIYFKFERDAATLSKKVQIIYSIDNMFTNVYINGFALNISNLYGYNATAQDYFNCGSPCYHWGEFKLLHLTPNATGMQVFFQPGWAYNTTNHTYFYPGLQFVSGENRVEMDIYNEGSVGGVLLRTDARLRSEDCYTVCGDGLRASTEGCDVGPAGSPGCVNCVVESGWMCMGDSPSVCSNSSFATTTSAAAAAAASTTAAGSGSGFGSTTGGGGSGTGAMATTTGAGGSSSSGSTSDGPGTSSINTQSASSPAPLLTSLVVASFAALLQ